MPEFAVTVERRDRGLDLIILRADDVRKARDFIPTMFREELVNVLVVRRYRDTMRESVFDPYGVLAREREDQRARRKVEADSAAPTPPTMTAVQALDELRSMAVSLAPDTDDIRSEHRPAFRNGFAQCRYKVRDLITAQIKLIAEGA